MKELHYHTVVIGSGASGYRAALSLKENHVCNICIITENRLFGTSRNAGSDKQTYYRLAPYGIEGDSVLKMAESLFGGGCMDGDQALIEAAYSSKAFYDLQRMGVPFPDDGYGQFWGYQTDHDSSSRATSAGPYTSKQMTESLEKAVSEAEIEIMDHTQALHILTFKNHVHGLLALQECHSSSPAPVLIWCESIILASGGPAAVFQRSVYPQSQLGSSSLAYLAGAKGKNVTEWQFGLASLQPRWNVSGSYMQVLPRFYSTEKDGSDPRDFLSAAFPDLPSLYKAIFLKGYEWPFSASKAFSGSSLIDLLVYQETVLKGRRVYLDFTRNPADEKWESSSLPEPAYSYLSKNNAFGGTPYERLCRLNEPAVQFYRDHQVDLSNTPLEIAVCAQHQNGGIATDSNWETAVSGLFAVGEACGTHGVRRPGGSALNAGQVGAIRSAETIASRLSKIKEPHPDDTVLDSLREEAEAFFRLPEKTCGNIPVNSLWKTLTEKMDECGGILRHPGKIEALTSEIKKELDAFPAQLGKTVLSQYSSFYHLYDLMICQYLFLTAMQDYASRYLSRGSALYYDPQGNLPHSSLQEVFRSRLDPFGAEDTVQEISLDQSLHPEISWRNVRPIPHSFPSFEVMWKAYREKNKSLQEP